MRKFYIFICLFLFILGFNPPVFANSASQVLVAQGRSLLFPNTTYSGILAANDKFKAALAEDSSDQEANLFYAVTRLIASALKQGSGAGLETLRDAMEAFGMTRNSNNLLETGFPFDEPPVINGDINFPETTPAGEEVRVFLSGPFLELINEVLINLSVITDSFSESLTVAETGTTDIEIDYADILIYKSFLNFVKSFISIITSYNMDVDIRELTAILNIDSDFFNIQRDLLDKYPDFLKLISSASLDDAKTALIQGIDAYGNAYDFIIAESDYQGNDLFFFETPGDLYEARDCKAVLDEVKRSLLENNTAIFQSTDEIWIFTDNSGEEMRIKTDKNINSDFSNGEYQAYPNWNGWPDCGFVSCFGEIESWEVSGSTVIIRMSEDYWQFPVEAELTGTINGSGDQITSGSFTVSEIGTGTVIRSGTFTATRQSAESDTETIELNNLFGNTGKDKLNVRDVLPEFDQYNEIIPGTFPPVDDSSPVMNGIFPDTQTNNEIAIKMGLIPSDVDIAQLENFVTGFYEACLLRSPDQTGLTHWVNALLSGEITAKELSEGFLFSPEFTNLNTTDQEFVTTLYQVFMGREPDAGGLTHWINNINDGMSRSNLLDNFAGSNEFENICSEYGINAVAEESLVEQFVIRFYEKCLNRVPDQEGLNHWVNGLENSSLTGADLAESFIFSQEFYNIGTSDEEFLLILYQAFFNRQPDTDGYNHWADALNNGTSRANVLDGFTSSVEFETLCGEYNITPNTQ